MGGLWLITPPISQKSSSRQSKGVSGKSFAWTIPGHSPWLVCSCKADLSWERLRPPGWLREALLLSAPGPLPEEANLSLLSLQDLSFRMLELAHSPFYWPILPSMLKYLLSKTKNVLSQTTCCFITCYQTLSENSMCWTSMGMHLPSMLLPLETWLTCLHTLCAPPGTGWQHLATNKRTGGKKRERENCTRPLTVHWIAVNLPWNSCR